MARKLLSLVVAVFAVSSVVSAQRVPVRRVERDLARELACGPLAVVTPPDQRIRIIRGEDEKKALWGTNEAIIVNAGAEQGLKVGQDYFIRRAVADTFALPVSGLVPLSIRTAGWVRIVEVNKEFAVARITHACDGVIEDDYLEPFVRAVVPVRIPSGEPDYANAGLIVMGDERRQTGAAGDMMVLDRGSDHGVRPGQRMTVFRDTFGGIGPIVRIGEATAVIVKQDMSVVRIESSRDVVYVGDRVALQK